MAKVTPMIGQTLTHYRIESKLGEGGMGVVFKAWDTHLDRPVAIKVLPPETVVNPERKRRFVQEAKAASALNHPNIIHVYDIDTAAPQGYSVDFIAMEFVEGRTLHDYTGGKGCPYARRWCWPGCPLGVQTLLPTELTPFVTEAGNDNSPAWSPDGKTLAYVAEVAGVLQIHTRSLDAPAGTRVTSSSSTYS